MRSSRVVRADFRTLNATEVDFRCRQYGLDAGNADFRMRLKNQSRLCAARSGL
jgi:hypothetical protein